MSLILPLSSPTPPPSSSAPTAAAPSFLRIRPSLRNTILIALTFLILWCLSIGFVPIFKASQTKDAGNRYITPLNVEPDRRHAGPGGGLELVYSETVPFGTPGREYAHITNFAFPSKPFAGINVSPNDPDKIFIPPCPSILSPPAKVPLPPLFCPGQFLPLHNFNNFETPLPLQMKWLEQDTHFNVQKVRQELERDRQEHSPEGIRRRAEQRAQMNTFHTITQFQKDPPSHPLVTAPPTLDSLVPHRRLFDFIIINSELEWLDLRLQELWSVVDVFVITESRETFSGKQKPLYYDTHKQRYAHYQSKILHVIIDALGTNYNASSSLNARSREHYQRWWPFNHQRLQTMFGVRPGDLLMSSGIHDFPRTVVLDQLKSCSGWESLNTGRIALRPDSHYSSSEFHPPRPTWTHPHLHVYEPDRPISKHVMQWITQANTFKDENGPYIWKGAWHCTSCVDDRKQSVKKFESFSDQKLSNVGPKSRRVVRPPAASSRVSVIPKSLPHILTRQAHCYAHLWSDRDLSQRWWEQPQSPAAGGGKKPTHHNRTTLTNT